MNVIFWMFFGIPFVLGAWCVQLQLIVWLFRRFGGGQ